MNKEPWRIDVPLWFFNVAMVIMAIAGGVTGYIIGVVA